MKTLFINGCISPNSRTLKIARHLINNYYENIEEADLSDIKIKPIDKESFLKRGELLGKNKLNDPSFDLLHQFKEAETIIIAAPYYDFGLPSSIKAYLDDVLISGITFGYDEFGKTKSFSNVKKVILITTAGGSIYKDNAFQYIYDVFSIFFGVTDIKQYKAENLDILNSNPVEIINNVIEQIDKEYNKSSY
jgi:FMN-dependent NADH-azoreductase